MPVASCIPFPFFAPCDVMLIMLVCATRWLFMHLCTLAYMFMHKSCLLVSHPCFKAMKLWTFDPNLHLSPVNTTYCLPFLLVCLLACLLAFLFLCLPCLSCLSALCLFIGHLFLSIACLLVSCSCLCMYTHGARTHGVRTLSPRCKHKGWWSKHVDISQAAMFSRFRGLASPIWLCTFLNPFLPPSFLSWIGCIRFIMPWTICPHL